MCFLVFKCPRQLEKHKEESQLGTSQTAKTHSIMTIILLKAVKIRKTKSSENTKNGCIYCENIV